MSKFVHRMLTAYRPIYLRGLLMDGQYRLPVKQEPPPAPKGNRVILRPAFDPGRQRVLAVPGAARENLEAVEQDEPLNGLRNA